jgi:multicomponent Na+:H+ antiporter subunit E
MVKFLISIAGRFIVLSLALMAVWLLLSGYFDKTTLLVFGVFSALLCAWLTLHMGILDDDSVPLSVMPGIFFYWLWLFVEIGKSNFIVAMKVWSPKMSLSPQMIRVKACQQTDTGKATFANSITLTPGTVSVDLLGEDILIHALTEDMADISAIEDMGRRVCRVEGHVHEEAVDGAKEEAGT